MFSYFYLIFSKHFFISFTEEDDPPSEPENNNDSGSSGSEHQSRSRVKKSAEVRKPRIKKTKTGENDNEGNNKSKSGSRSTSGVKKRRAPPIPRQCNLCGKVLSSDYNLMLHMRVHNNDKPWICEEPGCGKAFVKPENLRTHIRSHTKERPYLCEICNCRFSYRVVLRTHKAAKHKIYDSEGVFECVCGEKTIAENFLRKHFRSCSRKKRDKQDEEQQQQPNVKRDLECIVIIVTFNLRMEKLSNYIQSMM